MPLPATKVAADATDKNKFVLTVDGLNLTAGCWAVQAESGGLSSNRSDKFAIEPNPTIESAVHNDKIIMVTGTDLVDFSHCGGQKLKFQLLQDGTTTAVPVDVLDWNNGKPVLSLPDAAKANTWKGKVQILFNGTLVTTHGDVELKPISQ